MLLLLGLICGSFTAVHAEDSAFYTLTPANGTNNGYDANCDVTISNITWNVTGNSRMTPWRIGGKSITKKDREVYSKTAMGSPIGKVALGVGAASGITVNSLKLTVASDANFSNVVDNVTAIFNASSTITFEPSASVGSEWPNNSYYKFTFNVTVSGNSNKFVEFAKAEFFAPEGGLKPAGLSIDNIAVEVDDLEKIAVTTNSDGAITYVVEDPTIADVEDGYVIGLKQGKTTITATQAATDEYLEATTTFTARVKAVGEVFYESFDLCSGTGGNDGLWSGTIASTSINNNTDNAGWTFVKDGAGAACAKLGTGNEAGSAEIPEISLAAGEYTLTFNAGGWGSDSENKTLAISATNATVNPTSVTMTAGAFQTFTAKITVAAQAKVKIKFAGSGKNNRFFLDEVSITKVIPTATIKDAKWATYIATSNVSFPATVAAYIVTGIGETSVQMEEVLAVEKGTAVLLNGDAGTYNLSVEDASDCDDTAENLLEVSAGGENNVYVLTRVSGVVGFYEYEGSGLPAGRVFLPKTVNSRSFLRLGGEESTGIERIDSSVSDSSIYNLQGQRIAKATHGLYIVNGKKVIIK